MMNRSYRLASSLFLAAAIAAPVSMLAAPAPQDASVQVRVYDRDHKDYHNWDDNENKRWSLYLYISRKITARNMTSKRQPGRNSPNTGSGVTIIRMPMTATKNSPFVSQ
jgi:hypothetical protein